MTAIDQVIARARQGEVGFTERKQFKLARGRAIEQLRRFALADPYFYILELIQAAVAGGADSIDIACGGGEVLISWTGGVWREDELAQLFDFLFASKQRLDLARLRSLALGVNALLLFEPAELVIESGDGSEGGTTRMVVRAGAKQVDVGRSEGRLAGTYLRATKLARAKVGRATGRRGGDAGELEHATIEARCLAAPVPLVFNGESMFGWARQRVPNLYGYRRVQSFDEGDLYGTIGLEPSGGQPNFALMTHGVWVQSYEHDLIAKHKIGGVVCFDRLNKTIDHSGFVRDERFAELWTRLRPYAQGLVSGKRVESPKFTSGEGFDYTAAELREFLREHPRVVIIPPRSEAQDDGDLLWRGKSIARLLDATILRVEDSQVPAVRMLGEAGLLLWRPQLSDSVDQRFYLSDELAPPKPPYLLSPVALDAVDYPELLAGLAAVAGAAGPDAQRLQIMLGETGKIRATLYSPDSQPGEPESVVAGLLVRVTTAGRLLEERLFASAYAGRVLDVELPTAQPGVLRAAGVCGSIAQWFASRALPRLREQDERALAGLGVGAMEPGTGAARLALQVLSRVTVTRLRPGLSFSLLQPVAPGFDPLSLPLLRSLAGEALSLRELARRSEATGGLVYGTIPAVPAALEGLDRRRILALDPSSERMLIGLLGEAGYVRVDGRDTLACAGEFVIRDLALGLREYADFPLLLEARGPQSAAEALAQLDEQGQAELLTTLLRGLMRRVCGEADEAGADPWELEEHRRQAVRHLQWYVCREYARSGPEGLERAGLLDFPLFVDLDEEVWALRGVALALRSGEGLLVHYGHSLGGAELGKLSAAARSGRRAAAGRPASLALSAFGYGLLAPLGRLRLAFDFDLDDIEARANPAGAGAAFLVEERFTKEWGAGLLGVPAQALDQPRILLRSPGQGAVAALAEHAQTYGVVGTIALRAGREEQATATAILAAVDQLATALLERLIAKLPELLDDHRHEAALRVLLSYTGEQLRTIVDASGLVAQVSTPLATRILGLPLFDVGAATLVSGQAMIDRFRRHFEDGYFNDGRSRAAATAFDWSAVVVAGTPKFVLDWLDAHLQPAAVIMPASSGARAGAGAGAVLPARRPRGQALDQAALAWNLEHWLAELRPDRRAGEQGPLPNTRVWVVDGELEGGELLEGNEMRMNLGSGHPLVATALTAPAPSKLAWLLFAIYARINAVALAASDADELRFHLIVGEALAAERLQVLMVPAPDA